MGGRFEVDVEVRVSVVANNFQEAADLAQSIVNGDRGKPDSTKIVSVVASQVVKA